MWAYQTNFDKVLVQVSLTREECGVCSSSRLNKSTKDGDLKRAMKSKWKELVGKWLSSLIKAEKDWKTVHDTERIVSQTWQKYDKIWQNVKKKLDL